MNETPKGYHWSKDGKWLVCEAEGCGLGVQPEPFAIDWHNFVHDPTEEEQ